MMVVGASPVVMDAECAVCQEPIPKGRVHYGGVSCYSCRAFFRRNTQRDELPMCKNGNSCQVTYPDRKTCSACRYRQCINTGMKPELVLDEGGKQERFKKHLRKKEEELKAAVNLDGTKPLPPLIPNSNQVLIPEQQLLHLLEAQKRISQNRYPLFPNAGSIRPAVPMVGSLFPFPAFPTTSSVPTASVGQLSPPPSSPPSSEAPVDLTALSIFHARHNLISPHLSEVSTSSLATPVAAPHIVVPAWDPHYTTTFAPPARSLPGLSLPRHLVRPSSPFRGSVIRAGSPVAAAMKRERTSSSEEEEAISSKRQYQFDSIPGVYPGNYMLYGDAPLPLDIEINEHVVIKEEPVEEALKEAEEVSTDLEDHEEKEASLLEKYCHKKLRHPKTFSADLKPIEQISNKLVPQQRPSVIVPVGNPMQRAPASQLRNFRIARTEVVVKKKMEVEVDAWQKTNHDTCIAGSEEISPVDLSPPHRRKSSCASPSLSSSSEPETVGIATGRDQ